MAANMVPSPSAHATPAHMASGAGATHDAEMEMIHHILVAICIAVPMLVGLWVGLMAIAVSMEGIGYEAPLEMGAAIGVLAGLFFGTWLGFVWFSQKVDQDHHD